MTMPATRVSVADTSDARGLAKGNGTPLGADSGAEGAVAAPQWGPPRVGGRGAWDTAAPGTLGRQSGGVRVLGRATVPCRVTVSRQWPAWSREPRAQALCSLTTWRPTGPPAAPPGPAAAAGPVCRPRCLSCPHGPASSVSCTVPAARDSPPISYGVPPPNADPGTQQRLLGLEV